ncbi:paar repeat-containing protein [Massilia sp. LjRoot122]|uniref:paar repeat-containing protein n=1 Tax=Massilia sp. LjRoot122 TaxID=3342257 RepID=UPI003ECC8B07
MSDKQPSAQAKPPGTRQERVARNAQDLRHPNVAAFLKAIAAAEGGGYDFKYGALKGRPNDRWRFTDMSTHPGPGIDGKTTAAGMYQITRPTWQHHGGKLGLVDFSPRTQDLIAVEILHGLGVVEEIKAGEIVEVMPKVARTWAALPKGPGQANHYPPQRYVGFDSFVSTYLAAGGRLGKGSPS